MLPLGDHGARAALRDTAGALGHGELAARVERTAADLAAAGLAAGQRVAVACAPRVDAIVRALAAARCGATVLPLDPALPAADAGRQAEAFGADWRLDAEGGLRPGPGGAPRPEGEAPAQALASSGSSGAAKLVLRSRAQVEAGVRIYAGTLGLAPDDRVLASVSLGHSYGFNSQLLATLAAGAELVLPASGHPRDLLDTIERHSITRFGAPPVLLDLLCRFQEAPRRLASLRSVVSVGEALPTAVHERFAERFGIAPWQSYGASEAGPALLNREDVAADGVLALGRPYRGVRVDLLDEAGQPVADGEPGELAIRSPAVALGYDGEGEGDGASRIVEGVFFTADLGFRRGGLVHFGGRRKLLIATGGRKVAPEEVERVLRSHPRVGDAAVVARRSGEFEKVVALVVARGELAASELLGFCAGRLAAWKVPAQIEFRASLPRGASGKLLRERIA